MTAAEEIRNICAEHMVAGTPLSDALLAVAAEFESKDREIAALRNALLSHGEGLSRLDARTIGLTMLG